MFVSGWVLALEALSATLGVSQMSITATVVVLAAVVTAISLMDRSGWHRLRTDVQDLARAVARLARRRTWYRWPLLVSLAAATAAMVASLVVAVIGAPNNNDSLGYHLPRVMWWLQEGHVGPYVTPDFAQATFPPLQEYLLLLVYGIAGSDLLVNLVQFTAWVLMIAALVYVAREVLRSGVGVAVAFVLLATIPTGIVQATTTQSDLTAALWPLLALALVVGRANGRIRLGPYVVLLALAAALTMAAKPTGAIATGLVVLLGAWWELRPPTPGTHAGRSWRASLSLLGATALGALAGGLPQVLRNLGTTGSPMGVKTDIFVASPSLATTWANTIRTIVNNIGIPQPLSTPLNEHLESVLALVGVPWTDPDAIYFDHIVRIGLGRNEDMTTNPVHLILGLVAAITVLLMRSAPRQLRAISAVAVLAFIATAGVMQWQIWSTRFFLASVALFVLPLAWLLARWLQGAQRPTVRGGAAIMLLIATSLYGLAVAVAQEYRPLIGSGSILTTPRSDQYFRVLSRPGAPDTPRDVMLMRIEELAELPAGSTIGLHRMYGQEYIVWRFLNADGQYRFVNLLDLDGNPTVDQSTLDGEICERDCP